jgi:hypothetical protein
MFHLDVSKVGLVLHMLQCYTRMLQTYILSVSSVFQAYVANVSFGCFKSISCVAGRCLPAAAGVPPWFMCGCLRPADASTARIRMRSRWARVAVPPCGCGGAVLSCWAQDGHGLTLVGKAQGRGSCVWIHRKENCLDNQKKKKERK